MKFDSTVVSVAAAAASMSPAPANVDRVGRRGRNVSFGGASVHSIPRSIQGEPGSPAAASALSVGSAGTNQSRVRIDHSDRSVALTGNANMDPTENDFKRDMMMRQRVDQRRKEFVLQRQEIMVEIKNRTKERDEAKAQYEDQDEGLFQLIIARKGQLRECSNFIDNLGTELNLMDMTLLTKYGERFSEELERAKAAGPKVKVLYAFVESMEEAQLHLGLTELDQYRGLPRPYYRDVQRELKSLPTGTDPITRTPVFEHCISESDAYKAHISNLFYEDNPALPIITHFLGTEDQAMEFETSREGKTDAFVRFRLALQLGVEWQFPGATPFEELPTKDLRDCWNKITGQVEEGDDYDPILDGPRRG